MTEGDKTIPHEELVREVIADEVDGDFVTKVGGTIASPGAPGASYVQAEMTALKTAIDAIRTKLTASGLTD